MSDIKSMEKATSKTSVFLPLSSVQQFASINNDNKSDIPLKKAESISICNPSVTQAQGFPLTRKPALKIDCKHISFSEKED